MLVVCRAGCMSGPMLGNVFMPKRNLILIHRGPEYEKDFDEIAGKVNALDRDITVYHLPASLEAELPVAAWRHPTVTVALVSRFQLPVKRGPILRNAPVQKLAQQDMFRKHGIPTPPAQRFEFGMKLDPIVFGSHVVVKSLDLRATSHGDMVFFFRRDRLSALTPHRLPADHPIRRFPQSFMVQRYIHTGSHPRSTRVGTFFGQAVLSYDIVSKQPVPDFNLTDEQLERASVASNHGERDRSLLLEEDALRLAEKTHAAFGDIPLLGIDLVRDVQSGKLFVLEVNAGGNTWHFSSGMGENLRRALGAGRISEGDMNSAGRLCMMEQLGAFDRAAHRLVEKTIDLAA